MNAYKAGTMQPILNRVARANDVDQKFLEYVGMQDERHTVGKIFYLFNIMDPAHQRYKSTVTFVEKVEVGSHGRRWKHGRMGAASWECPGSSLSQVVNGARNTQRVG